MKKLYILMALILVSAVTFGQMIPKGIGENGKILNSSKTIVKNSTKATTDTLGWSAGSIPLFADPSGEIHTYIMVDANQVPTGYWFGTNADSTDYWAQGYVSGAVKISGVLALLSGKYNGSASAASVMETSIYNIAADNAVIDANSTIGPGPNVYGQTALGTASKTITALDTANSIAWGFNYFQFPSLVSVAADFAIVANFKTIREHGDTAYMFCDGIGDGLGMNYSFYNSDPQKYYWVAASVSTLDVNMSLFAVIDDGAGITDNDFFQGIKMSVRNNPSVENTFVDYNLQYDSNVKLYIYDEAGREVSVINEGSKKAGTVNTIAVNTSNFKKGNYFVALSANGNRFTKKLVVE